MSYIRDLPFAFAGLATSTQVLTLCAGIWVSAVVMDKMLTYFVVFFFMLDVLCDVGLKKCLTLVTYHISDVLLQSFLD